MQMNMQLVDELDLGSVVEALRQGTAVRLISDKEASEETNFAGCGHLVLAAEKATPESLRELLLRTEQSPVFATTRDRLEMLRIGGVPLAEDGNLENSLADSEAESHSAATPSVSQLALAAAQLAGSDAENAQAALHGFVIRCSDWGGVVNCPRAFEAAVDLSRLAGLVPAAVVCRISKRATGNDAPFGDETFCPPTVLIRSLVEYRRARANSMLTRHGPRVRMPTRHGKFTLQAYEDTLTGQLHLALWTGTLTDPTLTRVHSECLTGDVLGSLRCDCGSQLDRALARLAQEGRGLLLYLRQEGRGIGLINKLRTYAIQDQGFDTVEANERLGFSADLRDYSLAAQMLVDLGIRTINLLTNNPQKVRGLKKHGIQIAQRVPLVVEPCSENHAYLDVKRTKLGHWLP